MSDQSQGPGWWQASDGKWYSPELHPAGAASSGSPTHHPVEDGGSVAGATDFMQNVATSQVVWPSKRGRRTTIVAGASAALVVMLAVVLIVVISGGGVATALFGGSGTATVHIHTGGDAPTFDGAIGGESLGGKAVSDGGPYSARFSMSGAVGGTAFALTASLDTASYHPGQPLSSLVFKVTGNFGSQPVRGTLTWKISTSFTSDELSMTVRGTVGSHTLSATGVASGNSPVLSATFHYTVT